MRPATPPGTGSLFLSGLAAITAHVALLWGLHLTFDVVDREEYRSIELHVAANLYEAAPASWQAQPPQETEEQQPAAAEITPPPERNPSNPAAHEDRALPAPTLTDATEHEPEATGAALDPEPDAAPAPASPSATKAPDSWLDPMALSARIASINRAAQAAARRTRVRRLSDDLLASRVDSFYLQAWQRKIETVGNLNYPHVARQAGMYAPLRLAVHVHHDGSLLGVQVLASSGYPELDEAATRIVRLAAPFAPFPSELRRAAETLEIVRTWRFQSRQGGG